MSKEVISGIYKITSPTNKIYIGQSLDIYKRWLCYKRYDCIGQPKLYRSLKKYKPKLHKFEIIIKLEGDLDDAEAYYIWLYNTIGKNGLNLREGGAKSKYSKESRVKMRNAKLGKKRSPHSEETKRKIKESCLKRNYKPNYTPEQEIRYKDAMKLRIGVKASEEARANMRIAQQKRKEHPDYQKSIEKMLETRKKNKLKKLLEINNIN